MRKAFDANIPKLKPRLRPAIAVVSETTQKTQDESTKLSTKPISENVTSVPDDVSDHDSTNTEESSSTVDNFSNPVSDEDIQPDTNSEIRKEEYVSLPDQHETIARNIVQFPHATSKENNITENKEDIQDSCSQQKQDPPIKEQSTVSATTEAIQPDITNVQIQSTENLKDFGIDTQAGMQDGVSSQSATISPEVPVHPIDDSDSRRKRLENVKRRVAEAVRPEVHIEPVPEDPAVAAESVLELVSDLEMQLSRSRELEKALRSDLAEAKAELARTVNEGHTASGRLMQTEAQLDEKRKVLEEMLFEMGALEEERDQAVRMVQMLTAKNEGRQLELNDLGQRYAEMQHTLDESKAEEERLTNELDERIAENARLHALLAEITRERDGLSRNVEQLSKERDELTESKKALEKVHHALSQARARLRE